MTQVSVDAVLQNIKMRHARDQIYTYIGPVLISVNPFKRLPLYEKSIIDSYVGRYPHEVSPHTYAVAEAAFRNMLTEEENQAVIISGESGAGKTEVAKQIMQVRLPSFDVATRFCFSCCGALLPIIYFMRYATMSISPCAVHRRCVGQRQRCRAN